MSTPQEYGHPFSVTAEACPRHREIEAEWWMTVWFDGEDRPSLEPIHLVGFSQN